MMNRPYKIATVGLSLIVCLGLTLTLSQADEGFEQPQMGVFMEAPPEKPTDPNEVIPLYQTGVRQDKILPQAFYGRWNIVATIVETDAPEGMFKIKSSDIWELSQNQHVVTVENVLNRANASVSIDEVNGMTATFHHTASSSHTRVLEVPTVTVDGNHLSGINYQTLQYLNKDRVVKEFKFIKKVEGHRLASESFQFKPPSSGLFKPEFEVSPLEVEN